MTVWGGAKQQITRCYLSTLIHISLPQNAWCALQRIVAVIIITKSGITNGFVIIALGGVQRGGV